MTSLPDDDRLAILLRAIPTPEPPADFLVGARRRYLEGLEARYRREVLIGLASAAVGFGLAVALLVSVFETASPIAWVAATVVGLARWVDGLTVVLSCVPSLFWVSSVLGSIVSLTVIVSLVRARSPAVVK